MNKIVLLKVFSNINFFIDKLLKKYFTIQTT